MPGRRQNESLHMALPRLTVRCNCAHCHRTFGRSRSYQCMSGWHCDSGVQEHRCVLSGTRSKPDPKLQCAPHIRPRLPPCQARVWRCLGGQFPSSAVTSCPWCKPDSRRSWRHLSVRGVRSRAGLEDHIAGRDARAASASAPNHVLREFEDRFCRTDRRTPCDPVATQL
jgi:hypothetical protein